MTAIDVFVDAVEACQPELVGVTTARDQLPGSAPTTITHAGPPLERPLDEGPLLGAVVGGLLHDGWSVPDAREAASTPGALDLRPNQDNGRAAPLAGVVTPGMPLLVVADRASGTVVHAPLNEGLGAVLRFGAHGPEALDRLAWIRDVAGPTLAAALQTGGPVPLRPIVAGGLRHGDELHNRNNWTTAAFVAALEPRLGNAGGVARFLARNSFTFLNLSVAFAKCVLDAVAAVAPPGVVVAMGSNGRAFGIKVAGVDGWVTSPPPFAEGRLDAGRSTSDASPILGDSCLIEALGLGGLSLAAAPEVAAYLGCDAAELDRRTRAGWASTVATHRSLRLPLDGGRGAPLGIHVRLALASTVRPVIDAGVAHRRAGVGQIGAGPAEIPRQCLRRARDRTTRTNPLRRTA